MEIEKTLNLLKLAEDIQRTHGTTISLIQALATIHLAIYTHETQQQLYANAESE